MLKRWRWTLVGEKSEKLQNRERPQFEEIAVSVTGTRRKAEQQNLDFIFGTLAKEKNRYNERPREEFEAFRRRS